MTKKQVQALVKAVKEQEGVITGAIASSQSVDRDGDVLVASGWQLDNFVKNPVLLWSHNPFIPPIGKVLDIRIDNGQLIFDAQFAIEENELAKQVFNLMKGGFINTFSVGYIPKMQDAEGKTVAMELLEISAVSIPANPDATVTREFRQLEAVAVKMAQDHPNPLEKKEEVVEEKAGAVISAKNRSLIELSIEGMKQATGALETLLAEAEKGARPPIYPPTPTKAVEVGPKKELLRALRLADKAMGHALHVVKSNTGLKGGEMK
jgi:HK97 family phage prohead protease